MNHPIAIRRLLLGLALIGAFPLAGQNPMKPLVIGAYDPRRLVMSPGQIVTLFVYGAAGPAGFNPVFGSVPFATNLGGITVELHQMGGMIPAPVMALTPISTCFSFGWPCERRLLAVTVQAPFELTTPPLRPVSGPAIAVYERGELLDRISLSTVRQNPQIVDRDRIFPLITHAEYQGEVYHTEGRWEGLPATGQYPAQPSEVLSLFAVGLGRGMEVSPRPIAGHPSPAGVKVGVGLAFDFGRNPMPRRPEWYPGDPAPEGLISAGLVPGRVGIYEVRFRVPGRVPAGTPSCTDPFVWTNASVSVGSLTDFTDYPTYDGTKFCVEAPAPSTGSPSKQ